MNKHFLYFLLIITVLFTAYSTAQAKRFHDKKGHEIEILWKLKGTKLKAWGKVSGGKETCKQMNYSITFWNSESSRSSYIHGFIENYRPDGRNNFNGSDRISETSKKLKQRSDKNAFYVKRYYIECLN